MSRNAENTTDGINEAVANFSTHMKHKLLLTRHRPHWDGSSKLFLFDRMKDEMLELGLALDSGERKSIVREAADVANFAMMIADNAQWEGTRPVDSREGK